MKTKLLLAVFAAAVLAFSLWSTRQIEQTRSSLADVAAQEAALRDRIARAEQRLRAAADALARNEPKATTNASATHGAKTTEGRLLSAAPGKPSAAKVRLSPETVIANDPARLAEYTKHFRDTLGLSLGGLFKALHFTPEQIERFKDMRANQEQRRLELIASAEMQGLDRYSSAYSKLTTKLFQESRKEETEFLGAGTLAQEYLDYRAKWYLRETTQRLGSFEVYPDTPLSAAQVERVTEIIAQNNQRRDEKKPEKLNWQTYGWSWQDWTAIDWEKATPQLRATISASQLDLLRQMLRPMEAHATVNARWGALRIEAQKITRRPEG